MAIEKLLLLVRKRITMFMVQIEHLFCTHLVLRHGEEHTGSDLHDCM